MPKMRYRAQDGVEFEFEGEPEEIMKLYQLTTGRPIHTVSPKPEKEKPTEKPMFNLPSDKEVEDYIKSKPNYQHDMFEVQRHFLGRKLLSRGSTAHIYHRITRQLRAIRKKIEKEEGGEFKEEFTKGGLKRYTFKKEEVILAIPVDKT